jgi:diamine N-acetyltransferase
MVIRKVSEDEILELSKICRQTYIDHYSHIRSQKGLEEHLIKNFSVENLSASFSEAGTTFFFVEKENALVGYFKLKIASTLPNSNEAGLELEKIYFLKTHTGKGMGSKTIDFIKVFAQENNQDFIWLDVLKNKPNAIRFYEKMGFQKAYAISFSTDILDIGMWVMALQL